MTDNSLPTDLSLKLGVIKNFSEPHYDRDDVHGWGHVLRVLENARRIHKKEGGDWAIIETMVWLHDIGRKYEDGQKKHHAEISAEMASQFLQKEQIPNDLIKVVCHGIRAHSFSKGQVPDKLEAKILSDADKLDAIGAVGIFRACAFQYQHEKGLEEVLKHFDEKLLILDQRMYLKTSIKFARERIARLKQFKAYLHDELI